MKGIPDSVKTAFFTVLFIFLFLYVFTRAFGPVPFSVNSVTTTKTDLFSVSGVGEATAVPDTAVATFGVTQTAPQVEVAKNRVNETVNAIVTGLKDLGVNEKKVKTLEFSVFPNYDYNSGRNSITGYTVTQNIRVEVTPIEKANDVLDMAAEKGANMVGSLQFTVDDEKKLTLEKQARDDAIKKAKDKAQSIANSAGIRLGKIVNVQESGEEPRPPVMYDMKAEVGNAERQDQTQLQPGENKVNVTVTLFYETF